MSSEKQDICALFLEDLITFSMDFYQIPWSPPFQLSEKRNNIPTLFTEDIGRTVLVITDAYQFRRIVENSEIQQYTMDENMFYNFVSNGACEYLEKSGVSSFFHMCAYVVQVSLFCQMKQYFSLQSVLISGTMALLVRSLNLDHPKVRLYYQNEAKCMNDARSKRLYLQLQEETAKKVDVFASDSTIDGSKKYSQSKHSSHIQNSMLYWRNTVNYPWTSSNCLNSQRFLHQGDSNSSNVQYQHSSVLSRNLMKVQLDSERYVPPSIGNTNATRPCATSSQTIIYPQANSLVNYYSKFPPPTYTSPGMMNHELENPTHVAYFPHINSSVNLAYTQRPTKNWNFTRKNKLYNPLTLPKQQHSPSDFGITTTSNQHYSPSDLGIAATSNQQHSPSGFGIATTSNQQHVLNANAPSFIHSSTKRKLPCQELNSNVTNQASMNAQSFVYSSIKQNQPCPDLSSNAASQTNSNAPNVVHSSNKENQPCQELNFNSTNQEDTKNQLMSISSSNETDSNLCK